MKTTIIKSISCSLILFGMTACSGYLDKESFDIITPEQVWKDPKLINGVLVNLYDGLQLEDFDYWYSDAWPLNMITKRIFDQSYGYRKWGKSQIYVSSGLSLWGPPFRIGTDSEMIVFLIK